MYKIKSLLVLTIVFVMPLQALAAEITVYKSPTCGCCTKWSDHLRKAGHDVTENKVHDVRKYKTKFGVPPALFSCHTAKVSGYVIEGHVPAADIAKLIADKPDIRGLTVPGMPMGSPGMEMGHRKDKYDVLAIRKDGSTYVFASH